MFTRIDHILPEKVMGPGLAPLVAEARAFERVIAKARELAPLHADAFRAAGWKDGTLTVACRTSGAAYALKGHEAALRGAAEGLRVERIRFMLTTWK